MQLLFKELLGSGFFIVAVEDRAVLLIPVLWAFACLAQFVLIVVLAVSLRRVSRVARAQRLTVGRDS